MYLPYLPYGTTSLDTPSLSRPSLEEIDTKTQLVGCSLYRTMIHMESSLSYGALLGHSFCITYAIGLITCKGWLARVKASNVAEKDA